MKYGAAIPPKTFFDTKPQFFTKQAFAHYLARALQSVGMVPMLTVNTYDLADPANIERDPGASQDGFFWWDYPTNETYALGAEPYRPCLGLAHSIRRDQANVTALDVSGKSAGYFNGYCVYFKHVRRRADRILRTDMRTYENQMLTGVPNTGNFGFGSWGDSPNTSAVRNPGSLWGSSTWKLFTTDPSAAHVNLLFVNRVFIHLGPAGLFVQIGTHPSRRDEAADIMNFACVFHGGRIPDRAYPEVDDVIRDYVDPTLWLDFHGNTDGSFTNATRAQMYSDIAGGTSWFESTRARYGATANFIGVHLRSIDFIDDAPVAGQFNSNYPVYSPTTLDGEGVHALHRACVQSNAWGRYSMVSGQVAHRWEDTWYAHGFALSDKVVAPGLRRDPRTNKDWYMIWATNRQQAFGIAYDGVTTIATPTAGASGLVLQETVPLDMTAVAEFQPEWTQATTRDPASSFFIGRARTLLGTIGGITIHCWQHEMKNAPSLAANRWTKPTGENGFSIVELGVGANDNDIQNLLTLELSGMPYDPRDWWYLEYEYRGRTNTTNSGDPALGDHVNAQAYYGPGTPSVGDSGAGLTHYLRSGAFVSYQGFYYNYKTYGALGQHYPAGAPVTTVNVAGFQPLPDGRASLSFRGDRDNTNGSAIYCPSFDIRNLVLKRYRQVAS